MGCSGSKEKEKNEQLQQNENNDRQGGYSWENREKVDPADFMFMNKTDETLVKNPGEINGQQFCIEECKNCNIFLLDHIDQVTVDACTDCTIVIGPASSSVFIRECVGCKIVVACQQFRTRDLSNCDILLYTMTQPIIETSTDLRFGCYNFQYDQLSGQFASAGLKPFCNKWSKIYDFNSAATDHWTFLDEEVSESLIENIPELLRTLPCPVPFSFGDRPRPQDETIFALCFTEEEANSTIAILKAMDNVTIVQTEYRQMTAEEIGDLFDGEADGDAWITAAKNSEVIGIEASGADGSVPKFAESVEVLEGVPPIFVPDTASAAQNATDVFFKTVSLCL